MQFGGTKYISGQVPWDSTTNSNRMQLTAYPFTDVPSGSTYSLQGTYQGAGANIQILDGTFTTLDELDMTFSVPSEMIGQTGASFILMFEDPDSNRDYFVYDVTGLTLAPDPTPRVNVTSGTTGVTVTPATYSANKTATGQVPYDTTTSANPITFNLAYTGTWSGSYTMIVFYWDEYHNRNQIGSNYNFTGNAGPASITFNATAANLVDSVGFVVLQNSDVIAEPEVDTSAVTLEPDPSLIGIQLTFENPGIIVSTNNYVYPGQTLYITGTVPNSDVKAEILLTDPIPSGDTWTVQRKLPNGTYYTISNMSNVGTGEDIHAHLANTAIYVPVHQLQSGILLKVIDQNSNEITSINIDATGATYVPISMFMETANANDIVGVQDSGDTTELSLKASDFGNITATLDTSGGDPWNSISNSSSYTFKFDISGTINSTPTGALNGHAITTSSTNGILFYITDISSSAGNITSAIVNSFAYDQSAYFIPVKFFANATSKGNRLTDPIQTVTQPGFFILMIPKTTFDAASTRTVKIRMKNGSSGSGYSYYQLNLTNVTVTT